MSIEINRIYNENCIDTMQRMEDNFIDLVVTSPPYDNLRDYKGYSFDFESIAKELYRVIKVGGVVVWVVNDATINGSESGTSFRQALYFKEIGFNLHDTMIYKKKGVVNPQIVRYNNSFEYMFILSKVKPKTINLIKDHKNKCYGNKQSKLRPRNSKGEMRLKFYQNKETTPLYSIRGNIWEYSAGFGKSYKEPYLNLHPAIFPEKLAHDHILSWSNENEIVYDPFMGSGTVAKMCLVNNRNYIGSEISKEYVQLIERRLNDYKEQLRLF